MLTAIAVLATGAQGIAHIHGCSAMLSLWHRSDSHPGLHAGFAVLRQSGPWSARTYFMNDLVDQSIRAWLLFTSAGCFSAIMTTRGRDISLLLDGLSAKRGLGLLFDRMRNLAWGMAMFR